MKMNQKNNSKKISRRNFFEFCGSFLAGGSILMISGFSLRRMVQYAKGNQPLQNTPIKPAQEEKFISPYKLISSFGTQGQIEAFELSGDKLYIVTSNAVTIYDTGSRLLNNFPIPSQVRDILVKNEQIYLLYPSGIEIYTIQGDPVRQWDACSELSDYCSFALAGNNIYVTDVVMKNICQYTVQGEFVRFIQSPNGFVIPSYTFGIEAIDNILYCSNSGRHLIEKYTTDGTYIGSFGQSGGTAGRFAGCCNPVHITHSPTGDIITSEKGNPRISCYSRDGQFRNILLDNQTLGGGKTAYDIKLQNDKIFVAGNGMISIYHYDPLLATLTACGGCATNCPLRKGTKIA